MFYYVVVTLGPLKPAGKDGCQRENKRLFPEALSADEWFFRPMTRNVYPAQVTGPASQSPTVKTIQSSLQS